MYPLTLRPEASSTCERVGALAAWASASVGAANAAETADAMRSFFIERPFVVGKILPLPFFSASNLPGCLMPGRIGPSPETPSPYLPDPDQRLPGFARAVLLKNVKNCRSCNPGNPRKDRPKMDFFQLPCCGGPMGAARRAAMMEMEAIPVRLKAHEFQREFTRLHLQHPQGLFAVQPPHDDPRAARAPAAPRRGHHFPAGSAGVAQPPRGALRGLAGRTAVRVSRRPGVARIRLRAQRRLRPRPPRQRHPQPLPDSASRKPGRLAPCPGASRHASLRDRAAGDAAAPALHLRAPRAARARASPPGRRDHRAPQSRGAR